MQSYGVLVSLSSCLQQGAGLPHVSARLNRGVPVLINVSKGSINPKSLGLARLNRCVPVLFNVSKGNTNPIPLSYRIQQEQKCHMSARVFVHW
jgi:hypothetical protein